jgi:Protein of unknown function (DUF2946)
MAGWRMAALAVAQFAITVNLLQPLAHAALMRDGVPSELWTMFCNSAAADQDDSAGSMPSHVADKHECCLGLTHAQALIEPPAAFVPVVFALQATAPQPVTDHPLTVGIRDGPYRPRGPPFLT